MLLFQDLEKMYDRFCKWDRLVRYLAEYSNNEQQNYNYSLIALTAQERYEQLTKNHPDFV